MSFAEGEAAVARLAGWLAELGMERGDRVATWLPKTRSRLLDAARGAARGTGPRAGQPALRRAQVAHILADSGRLCC